VERSDNRVQRAGYAGSLPQEDSVEKWKDETRRGEITGSVLKAGKFKISVHRHIHYPADMWLFDCYGLFDCKELASKNLEEAKCQAAALVQVELETAVKVIIQA